MNSEHIASSGVTPKAVIFGVILSFIIAAGEPCGVTLVKGSPLCADFSAGGAIFLFFILVFALNTLLKIFIPIISLSLPELIVVYIMMLIASTIPSWGFVMNLLPLISGVYYYATPENNWETFIHPHLPSWMVVRDREAVWHFFEGLPSGQSIPWAAWLRPLLCWSAFIIVLYLVMVSIMVILRKQWVEKEKLLFPLVQLPLEMVKEEKGRILPPLFKNKLMWIGFAIPFIINGLNALHSYFRYLPGINLQWSLAYLPLRIYYEVIGLSYLLSMDVALSLWLFSALAIFEKNLFGRIGFSIGPTQLASDPAPPAIASQAFGALIVFVAAGLWVGRGHLKDVFSRAFRGDKTVDDSNELMPYRVAVFATIFGIFFIIIWLNVMGLKLFHALILVFNAFIVFVGLSRVIAQTGLAYGRAAVAAPVMTINSIGTTALGPAGLVSLMLTFPWALDTRTFVMAGAANSLKLADTDKIRQRRLIWAILLAILIGLAASSWAVISLGYKHGGINLGGWQFGGLPQALPNWIANQISYPVPVAKAHLLFTVVGGLLMGGLTFLRNRFLWWPIHPIGLTVGSTLPMYYTWFSVFIAWFFKWLILRYGGPKGYRNFRPLFLGFILGGFTSAGVWIIIDFFTGMTGNVFTLG